MSARRAAGPLAKLAQEYETLVSRAAELRGQILGVLEKLGLALPPTALDGAPPAPASPPPRVKGKRAPMGSVMGAVRGYLAEHADRTVTAKDVGAALGIAEQAARDSLVRLVDHRKAVRVSRGVYRIKGAPGAPPAALGRPPLFRDKVAALAKRHRVITVELVAKELRVRQQQARQTLQRYATATANGPALLVRQGPGIYTAADGPGALVAALQHAVKHGRKPAGDAADDPPGSKNSAAPTGHPSA